MAFARVRLDEIPLEWRTPATCAMMNATGAQLGCPPSKVSRHIVVEVPDAAGFRLYQEWLSTQDSGGLVGVCCVNLGTFRAARGDPVLAATLRSLHETGLPLIVWARVWAPVPPR